MKVVLREVNVYAKPSGAMLLKFWIPWLIHDKRSRD
jgi:hypothetical protein